MKKVVLLVSVAVIFTMLLITVSAVAGSKVTICHKNKNSISVSENAVDAHLAHGDYLGPCVVSEVTVQPTLVAPTSTIVSIPTRDMPTPQKEQPKQEQPQDQPTVAPSPISTLPPSDSVCPVGCATGCCPGEEAAHYGEATRSVAEAEYWKAMATAITKSGVPVDAK